MNEKKKGSEADRLERIQSIITVLFLMVVIFALVLAVIVPMIQWQADIAACVRILGLDEAYCADYLRLIRE